MKFTRKSIGRIAASFVATAMLATMAIVPASAAGTTGNGTNGITSITVNKTITTDPNNFTYRPDVTFTYSVAVGDAVSFNDGSQTIQANPGVEGGLKNGTIVSSPLDEDGELVQPDNYGNYILDGSLAVDITAFTKANSIPGAYHYVVRETGSYDGMQFDGSVYDVYLYLMRNDNNQLYVGYVVSMKRTDPDTAATVAEAKSDLSFTNDYGLKNNGTHDVVVKKVVQGTFANMSDTFTFNVSVASSNNEYYRVVVDDGTGRTQTYAIAANAEKPQEVTMGNNGTIHIYGLSETDTYTVTETDNKGYTVSDTDTDSVAGTVIGNAATDVTYTTVGEGEDETKVATPTATIINEKNSSTPTGIMMDIAPYAVLVVIAAAGCFIFLRKRHAKED